MPPGVEKAELQTYQQVHAADAFYYALTIMLKVFMFEALLTLGIFIIPLGRGYPKMTHSLAFSVQCKSTGFCRSAHPADHEL